MHKDIVYNLPSDEVELLGSTPLCQIHGMYTKGRLISIQGHPEFTKDIVTEIVETRHGQGIFDDATYQDAMKRVGKDHDGVVVAQAFLRFLLED
jgi:GMP synthase-like glutamine amidotransferase